MDPGLRRDLGFVAHGKPKQHFHHHSAAAVSSERNQAWAGSLAARRCQAIDTVIERSIGKGRVSISAEAAIWRAVRLGTVAIRAVAANASRPAQEVANSREIPQRRPRTNPRPTI